VRGENQGFILPPWLGKPEQQQLTKKKKSRMNRVVGSRGVWVTFIYCMSLPPSTLIHILVRVKPTSQLTITLHSKPLIQPNIQTCHITLCKVCDSPKWDTPCHYQIFSNDNLLETQPNCNSTNVHTNSSKGRDHPKFCHEKYTISKLKLKYNSFIQKTNIIIFHERSSNPFSSMF